jgi:predicted ATPase
MSVRGIGNIERGVPLRVRKETLRLLAEALELAPEEQATLLETARKTAWQGVPRVADESRRRDLLSEPGGFATGDRPAPTDGMVPALSSLPALSARTAVPWPVTPLVGREREVAAASAYVRGHESRLLTLCGLGGAGKTRLAAQVVIECAGEFADGAGFVPLAPISDAHLVGLTIVRHLGLRVSGGEDALSVLRGYLADKRILLLLDNFEHVLEARSVIASLLAACPGVKAVVTSRAPLRLQGEQLFPVAPLATPGAEEARRAGHADIEALARAGAIALFLQRAREMVPDFALTDDNAGSIVRICQRVDGLPLAIELAVTRLRMFSAPELAERLEHRLPVLTGGAEDLPARQQTLRNTLTWSYRLLQPEHQALFRALAVFAGGCSWEALWAVSQAVGGVAAEGAGAARETAGDNGVGESEEALVAQVGCLLDHHLLERTETKEGVSRYWMLETIREFAQEMLAHCGETACVERAHARYYVARVEAIEPLLRGNQQTVWLTWLEVEHDNVRAALGWTLRQRDGVFALRLAGALGWFWYSQGYFREGARWLEQALALPAPPGLLPGLLPGLAEPVVLSAADAAIAATADSPVIPMSALAARETDREDEVFMLSQWQALRAKALHVAGLLACYQGDYPRARMLNEEALALRRSLGDLQGVARTLNNLALVLARQGDFAGAATRYEESLALKRQIGDVEQIATTLANLGSVYVDDGDYANARRVYEGCLEQWRDQGDDSNVARTLANLGEIALREGQAARAGVLLEESLTLRRTLGDKMGLANTLHLLGTLAFEQGDSAQAFLRFRESCDLLLAVGGDRRAIVRNLEALAALYCAEGEVERAVWLSSGAAALRARLSTPARPFEQAALERTIALEHDALDDASFARAWEKGALMRVEDVWELIRSSAIPASAHGAKSPL